MTEIEAMTTPSKRTTLLATSLAFGLLAALQLPQAVAQSEHDGHHPQTAPTGQPAAPKAQAGGMMNHGNMDHSQMGHGQMNHEQMMKQMHDQHMNHGQMDHGNMGQGQMNHGSMPPAKGAPASKDGKNGQ
jgi:uncharacterized protein involved in copper resistance